MLEPADELGWHYWLAFGAPVGIFGRSGENRVYGGGGGGGGGAKLEILIAVVPDILT